MPKKNIFFIQSLIFIMIVTVGCGSRKTPFIPADHPRVYINVDDLDILRQKVESLEFAHHWHTIRQMEHPFARAFVGLVTEDTKMSEEAASDFLPMLKSCTDARQPLNELQMGACIYDWAYYQMNDSLKQAYIAEFKRIAGLHEPLYPAKKGFASLVGHNGEGWLLSGQLPAGVAIYDEDPLMYDSAAVVFNDEFVPGRNFVYRAHMHHQGDSYAAVRFLHDLFAALLYQKMDSTVFSMDQQYVPYQFIYNYRPDSQQMRSGDTFDDAGDDGGGKSRAVKRKALSLILAGSIYDDPYQLDMSRRYSLNSLEKIVEFIVLPLEPTDQPIEELPLSKYFPQPMGEVVARTGWEMGVDSDDAVIQMRIGSYFFGNHQAKDFGIFQIYYKGPLAISSGAYEGVVERYGQSHWTNYHHQTISKNGLLIYDPDEKTYKNSVNDGGQLWPNKGHDHPKHLEMLLDPANGYQMGKVQAYAIGPDQTKPEYSYISGDITQAYDPGKAEEVKRSMLTIRTENPEYPALFFVFDKVKSTNRDFKKTWLIHSIQEPEIKENKIHIYRTGSEHKGTGDYNGQLVCQSLLPENPIIQKVGGEGKAFWIESSKTNYFIEKPNPASEEGGWRVEVSPADLQHEDLFFHAMVVTEAGNRVNWDFENIESKNMYGATGLDYAVLFNAADTLLDEVDFKLMSNHKGAFLSGLKPGRWELLHNDEVLRKVEVSKTSQTAYLETLNSGLYKMNFASN